jgi:hypothetical protein
MFLVLDAIEESKTGNIKPKTIAELQQEYKKKKKKAEADEIKPVVVNRSPGFSSIFKFVVQARWSESLENFGFSDGCNA